MTHKKNKAASPLGAHQRHLPVGGPGSPTGECRAGWAPRGQDQLCWRSAKAAVLSHFQRSVLLGQHGHLQTLGLLYVLGSGVTVVATAIVMAGGQ